MACRPRIAYHRIERSGSSSGRSLANPDVKLVSQIKIWQRMKMPILCSSLQLSAKRKTEYPSCVTSIQLVTAIMSCQRPCLGKTKDHHHHLSALQRQMGKETLRIKTVHSLRGWRIFDDFLLKYCRNDENIYNIQIITNHSNKI